METPNLEKKTNVSEEAVKLQSALEIIDNLNARIRNLTLTIASFSSILIGINGYEWRQDKDKDQRIKDKIEKIAEETDHYSKNTSTVAPFEVDSINKLVAEIKAEL